MPIVKDFDYYKPSTMKRALDLFDKYGDKAKALAGGTDLIIQMEEGIDKPDAVIDIKGLKELKKLKITGNRLYIGALVSFTDLIESASVRRKAPLVWEAALTVASVPVRNRATMAGNICSCVPCMDSAPALLVYEAEMIVKSVSGERRIKAADWFVAPRRTSKEPNEILVGMELKIPSKKHGTAYLKLKRYEGEDLAQACLGIMALTGNEYRAAYGSVGPVPIRAEKIEKLLKGKKLDSALIKSAQKLVEKEISPITDIRASKDYRMHMSKVMLERGLKAAVERRGGKGTKYGISLI